MDRLKRKLKFVSIAVASLAMGLFFSACGTVGGPDEDDKEQEPQSTVTVYGVPDGVEEFDGAALYVEEKPVPLYLTRYNDSQVWSAAAENRKDAGFAYFDFSGPVHVKIVYQNSADQAYLVRPSAYGINISVNAAERSVEFTLEEPGNYTIEPINSPKDAIYLFCNEEKQAEYTQNSDSVLYFGAGLHTADNDARIGSDNVIRVHSGQTVYLAEGAVVRAKILGDGVSDVRVAGRGILDGSIFERNPTTGKVTVPIEFNNCKNVTLEDFVLNDPAGWCIQFYFVEGGSIENVRMISSRSNGDGVSLQSCRDITVSRVLARTWDDCLVVKNYPQWSDRSKQGTTENIRFEYCTLWADLAQCMEVGYETVGTTMQNITFANITVLHALHKPVMSIHNANNADIKNVVFDGITVEDASMGQGDSNGNRQLVDITVAYSSNWSDQHAVTGLGSVDGVTISNVWVYSAKTPIEYRIVGCTDTRPNYAGSVHTVSNVTFDGIKIGTAVQTEKTMNITSNEYVSGVVITARESSKITGAAVYTETK